MYDDKKLVMDLPAFSLQDGNIEVLNLDQDNNQGFDDNINNSFDGESSFHNN